MSAFRPELVRPKLDYPRVPYHELLRRTVERYPDKWATVFHDQKLTFREIEGLSNSLANGLRDLGVSTGDRVALFMTNRPEYLISFEATSLASLMRPIEANNRICATSISRNSSGEASVAALFKTSIASSNRLPFA